MFRKKAGCCLLESIINWEVYNNNKLLISRKNVKSLYNYNNYLIYETNVEYNKFDIKNLIFTRKTEELHLEIDFQKKQCKVFFEADNCLKFDIECFYKINNEEIVLEYALDEEIKKLRIVFVSTKF